MRFTCLRENLAKSLSTVSKAIPIKHSLPVLTNVLIVAKDGRVKLSGTDLDTVITCFVGASVEEEGAITVPAKLLSEFITHLSSDTVLVYLKDDVLFIEAAQTKSRFNGMPAADYPDLPEATAAENYIEIEPRAFGDALSQVGFSVAADDTRPVFSGIYLTYSDARLTMVGSDGFRLSEKSIAATGPAKDFSVILSARILLQVSRILSSCDGKLKVFVNTDSNLCVFECGDLFVASRLIEGSYPDYKRIIPEACKISFIFDAASLLEAVKLTNVFAKDSNNSLKLMLSPSGVLTVTSSARETGENNTELSTEVLEELEEAFEIVFNARYLLEFLTNVKAEKLHFGGNDSTTPCLLKAVDTHDFLHVMAPLHINS